MSRRAASRHLLLRGVWRTVVGVALAAGGVVTAAQTGQGGALEPAAARADVVERTIEELQREMADGRTTSRSITAAHLARIAAYDKQGPAVNAYIALNPRALDEAEHARFEDHLTTCASCRDEVEGFAATRDELGRAVAEPPPPGLRDQVLRIIADTPQLPPSLEDRRRRERRGNRPMRTLLAVAAAG